MQRLFNDGWSFVKLPNGSTYEQAQQAAWQEVSLPHDFLISNHQDLYENADGWYRRTLNVPADVLDKVWLLRFDGVYMDCDVLVNGQVICTHRYGYTAFDAELSGHLHEGDNEVAVHIRHQSPNTRWYSGAGIYRDVTLHVLEKQHMPLDGVYVSTSHEGECWTMRVQTEVVGEGEAQPVHHLYAPDGALAAEACGCDVKMQVQAPLLWSCKAPNCYQLETRLGEQTIRQNVGFKSLRYDANEGLFLNGEHIKLHGVCLHHDLGALGAAFHEKAARRQLQMMKDMGANALRTAHNPPARQVMELCDRMGILVIDEAFDMWERPKNTYDYARFFPDCWAEDVASWVRRDRNHPSLLMWSIGNEILDTHIDERGRELTRMLTDEVYRHDPCRNGRVTTGLNYMPWENAQKCVDLIKLGGYNYAEKLYAVHHEKYPDWCIYGSETGSIVSSRGVYHFPADTPILSDADMQCSALGNSLTSWGTKDMRRMMADDLLTPYSMGQFIWSGIDYIGEPTPYHTRSSYFGLADTACYPKDLWHFVRSMWADAPMAHIGVHWDWNPGQLIDVNVMTNAAAAELFLNGASLGRKPVSRLDPALCLPCWQVPFAPGELTARCYDAEGTVIAECTRRTPSGSHALALSAEDATLLADNHDMTFVTVSAVDKDGHPVDNAVDRVQVHVSGSGCLMGLDNGDSTDVDPWKGASRRLFSGKLLLMIGATDEPGDIRIHVTAPGLEPAELVIPALPAAPLPGSSRKQRIPESAALEPVHIRRIELIPLGDAHLTPDNRSVSFRWKCHPDNAMPQPITWQVTNAMGIEASFVTLEVGEEVVTVHALGDGLVYLRALASNGFPHARLISQLEISISGLGTANLDPYGFITGGLYDLHSGEITPGNDKGIAFARDGRSMAGFTHVDFGPVGSDEITLPIFALDSGEYELEMYLGNPDEGAPLFARLPYQKPSRWNVYQPETYKLPRRITGLQTICFVMHKKIHLHGFSFTRLSRAWLSLSALEADAVYGDSFTRTADGVMDIGNNVSFQYDNMDFGDAGDALLTIDGCTPLSENPITIRIHSADGEATALASFLGGERREQQFRLSGLKGLCSVTFVFLPGSQFDFYGFRFERA